MEDSYIFLSVILKLRLVEDDYVLFVSCSEVLYKMTILDSCVEDIYIQFVSRSKAQCKTTMSVYNFI